MSSSLALCQRMPRVRTEAQLRLVLDAPPRPEKHEACGDATRWRELRRGWVAAWGGRVLSLEDESNEKSWTAWWKQSKTQFKELMAVAKSSQENLSANTAATDAAPPSKVAAVCIPGLKHVTTAWLQRNAPQIAALSVSELEVAVGEAKRVELMATVSGEERKAIVDYGNGDFCLSGGAGPSTLRRREHDALRRLANGPELEAAAAARRATLTAAIQQRRRLTVADRQSVAARLDAEALRRLVAAGRPVGAPASPREGTWDAIVLSKIECCPFELIAAKQQYFHHPRGAMPKATCRCATEPRAERDAPCFRHVPLQAPGGDAFLEQLRQLGGVWEKDATHKNCTCLCVAHQITGMRCVSS